MKNKKRTLKYFIIISITVIGMLPTINFYNYYVKHDIKKLFNADILEKYVNYTFYKLFNKSLKQDSVIAGKDDFLFLGNKYNNIAHRTNGLFRPTNKIMNKWTDKLKNLQTWYEDKGIKFVIVIAPNKHTIYREKLPNWIMKYDGKTITDDIVKYSEKKEIHLLDLRKTLRNKAKEGINLVYSRGGSHWNAIGASIAYNDTIDYLNKKYNSNILKVKYKIIDKKRGRSPLGDMVKIANMIKHEDNVYQYNIKLDTVEVSKINRQTLEIESQSKKVKNNNFDTNRKSLLIKNRQALENKKLLFLCDSFSAVAGIGNNILYNDNFNTIWKFHYSHLNGNRLSYFVSKHQPDIVIYQIVERNLFNAGIVKKISNIDIFHDDEKKIYNKIFDINNIKYKYYKNKDLSINNSELIATHHDPIIILNKLKTKSNFVNLHCNLHSSVKTKFQIFYKENQNDVYIENNSYQVPIKKGTNKISLSIPAKYINNNLRVDLVSKIGKYKINNFSIYE